MQHSRRIEQLLLQGHQHKILSSTTNHSGLQIQTAKQNQHEKQPAMTYSSFELPIHWRAHTALILAIGKLVEDRKSLYQCFVQLPLPTLFGRKFVKADLAFSLGAPWYEHIRILGGNIRINNVIPKDSAAVQACLNGNITLLQDLFKTKKVSPNDITPDSRPLLWVRLDRASVTAQVDMKVSMRRHLALWTLCSFCSLKARTPPY